MNLILKQYIPVRINHTQHLFQQLEPEVPGVTFLVAFALLTFRKPCGSLPVNGAGSHFCQLSLREAVRLKTSFSAVVSGSTTK